jgi:hypothetical protein
VGLKKSPQAQRIFFRPAVGNLDAMSTMTEHGLNDRRRAADATDRPDSADLRGFTRHTMPSKFSLKSLKTKDGHPDKVTHFFEGWRRVKNGFHQSQITPHQSLRGFNG